MKGTHKSLEAAKTALKELPSKYRKQTALRAIFAAIPYIGGPLDILLSGRGAKIQGQRIEEFVVELDKRLKQIESGNALEPNGALWDLLVRTFEGVARGRSEDKRKRFATIIVKQVKENSDINEAIDAVDLLSDLNDIHIEVLRAALNAPVCDGVFEGLKVVALRDLIEDDKTPSVELLLEDYLNNFDGEMLRIACAQLVAKGLLHDEGIGRLSTSGMKYFVITGAGRWFVDWILEENEL